MPSTKAARSPRPAPVQFRLHGNLGRLVGAFAAEHGLRVNEAAKILIALSVVALDARHYVVVRRLADALGGNRSIVDACVHVHAAMAGAAVATGRSLDADLDRGAFVQRLVESSTNGQGTDATSKTAGPSESAATPGAERSTAGVDMSKRRRRTIRRIDTAD